MNKNWLDEHAANNFPLVESPDIFEISHTKTLILSGINVLHWSYVQSALQNRIFALLYAKNSWTTFLD